MRGILRPLRGAPQSTRASACVYEDGSCRGGLDPELTQHPVASSEEEGEAVPAADRSRIIAIIAEAERRILEERANTLRKSHALSLQVNLQTGVANGVLVVRSVKECRAALAAP